MPFPVSDHCDGRRFFNPWGPPAKAFTEVLRWKLTSRAARWPRSIAVPPSVVPALEPGTVAATFVGQATFLVRFEGLTLVTDPVFSPCAGPFGRLGPRRVRRPAIPLDALPPLDVVLLSHNHYDHLDVPTLKTLEATHRPRVVTGLGNRAYLSRRGLSDVVELDWWETHELPDGTAVTYVPAQHFSARGPHDRCRTLWGGFVVARGGLSLYFAGDTGWSEAFARIGGRLGPFDLSLLPIGAYEPRWFMRAVHVSPEEAVEAHLALRSRLSVAMHFGTFRLTDEPIEEPGEKLAAALASRGVDPATFIVPTFGGTVAARRAGVPAA